MQDNIHAALRARGAAQDELLQEQSALAEAVQAAAAALEQHSAAAAGAAPGSGGGQLAALATPHSVHSSCGRSPPEPVLSAEALDTAWFSSPRQAAAATAEALGEAET
jgi:hypothetical protein